MHSLSERRRLLCAGIVAFSMGLVLSPLGHRLSASALPPLAPSDNQTPVLSFVEPPTPPAGSSVGGTLTPLAPATVTIRVEATDPDSGVASATIEVWHISPAPSFMTHTDTIYTPPYETTWPTDYQDNGVNEIRVTAFGAGSDVIGPPLSRTVNVNNATFGDAPFGAFAWQHIERVARIGITAGCAAGPPKLYCPLASVTRGQMAVFLVKAMGLSPVTSGPATFSDVPTSHQFWGFIERIYASGITAGCFQHPITGHKKYCPEDPVTRGQMAAFIVKALGQTPLLPSTPTFADVHPWNAFFGFIERIFQLGITAGCSSNPPKYCPSQEIRRDQMAVFLVKAFGVGPPP
jgi:hypothetical protein